MIKAYSKRGYVFSLQATGNLIDLATEALMIVDKLYESMKETKPEEAEAFREAIRAAVTDGPIMGNDESKEHWIKEIVGEERAGWTE